MRFEPGSDDPAHRSAAPGVRPFLQQGPTPEAYRPAHRVEGAYHSEVQLPGEHTTSLRPFVITAGRVSGVDPAIGLETQVSTTPAADPSRLSPEKRAIVALCAETLSVAEISARLQMHLGVTRILVGDLRAAGQLDVHVLESDFPSPETIMRVIRGLRSIS